MILVPRPLASCKYNKSASFHSASITPILLQWEWCHLPVLQRLQLMLPYLVLIERAVSRLFSICKCCGKGNCEKATVGSRGDRWQQGGTRYGCDIWSVDSPGGPLSRGDCPRRDRTSPENESIALEPITPIGSFSGHSAAMICGIALMHTSPPPLSDGASAGEGGGDDT